MDWFERITGFKETSYWETQRKLRLQGDRLLHADGRTAWGVGRLELPSLAQLRERTALLRPDGVRRVRLSLVRGTVQDLHADPRMHGALFQAASQFNLLEMLHEEITPEHGVAGYVHDPTQGPACAIAAGAGTIWRNYLVDLPGGRGQTRDRQIDCLADLGAALGNRAGELWRMRNGYALFEPEAPQVLHRLFQAATPLQLDQWRGLLRIGVQRGVQVTLPQASPGQTVSQAYCSALPLAYNPQAPAALLEPFAVLVLEAAYEATLLAAAEAVAGGGSPLVLLTSLGGGAFGNSPEWIARAIRRAVGLVRHMPLEVLVVTLHGAGPALREVVDAYA